MFGKKSEPAEEPGYDTSYYTDHPDENDGISVVSETLVKETLLKRTFAPQDYADRKEIVEAFKDGRVVVLCIEELDMASFYRIFDYVMGAVQALDGEAIKIDRETVVLYPKGVDTNTSIDDIEEEEFEEAEEEIADSSDDEE